MPRVRRAGRKFQIRRTVERLLHSIPRIAFVETVQHRIRVVLDDRPSSHRLKEGSVDTVELSEQELQPAHTPEEQSSPLTQGNTGKPSEIWID